MMRSAELDVELTKRVDQVIKVKIGGCVLARESCHHRAANFFFAAVGEYFEAPNKKKKKSSSTAETILMWPRSGRLIV